MKRLNFIDKVIFLLNSMAAALLLMSYLLPYLPPERFSVLAILSLMVPLLLLCNLFFLTYWILNLKRQWILSLAVLAIGYSHINSCFNFNTNTPTTEKGIKIMSFNVHLLNLYNWIETEDVPEKFHSFIQTNAPDILCVQEYKSGIAKALNYPYVYGPNNKSKSELVIFSNFKFTNTGVINFPNSANRSIFVDVKIKTDTLRFYNLHLQSTGINANADSFDTQTSDLMFNRLSSAFKTQQLQAELLASHMQTSPYKIVLCGDFNNNAHSYIYRLLKAGLTDTFEVAGKGFGSTYFFNYFPLRIDFILTDPSLKILNYIKYQVKYSDHYAISSTIKL